MAILLFRPAKKLQKSVERFHQQGIDVVGAALIDTVEVQDALYAFANDVLASGQSATCIFVSTTAADIIKRANITWPQNLDVIAVGSSTQEILASAGITAEIPNRYDTEGILAMEKLRNCRNKDFYLLKGHGGREDLKKELVKRGARVHEVNLYTRQHLVRPICSRQWQPAEIKCIIATSSEQLQCAFQHYDHDWLKTTKWIVVSQRIKEAASACGVKLVEVSHGASDDTLIGFVKQLEQ